jgi:transitional endoplasmic reticulum ATPase
VKEALTGFLATMHDLSQRKPPVPCLYVKSATQTWDIRAAFAFARSQAPCLVVFEDIDTVVTEDNRAYFFNEVDGLENNNGILMIATTNHRNLSLIENPTCHVTDFD